MKLRFLVLSIFISLFLIGCGKDNPVTATASTTTTVSGSAVAGGVTGSVTVRDANGKAIVTNQPVTAGVFSINLPNSALAGELIFEVIGTYTDEVSGKMVTLTATNPLALRTAAAHFKAGTAGNAPVTPGSTIIQQLVVGGQTLTAATTSFQNAFGYAPDLTAKPFDPYTTTITTQTQADQNAAFRVGMMSQLGSDLGLSAADLAEMPAKLAADLADGTLDGISGGNPVTFTSGTNLKTLNDAAPLDTRILKSVSTFAGSTANKAGVTPPTMGLPPVKLDAPGTKKTVKLPSGQLVDVTLDTYAQAPFKAGFWVSAVRHKVTLTDNATQQPIDVYTNAKAGTGITNISQFPLMYMNNGHNHSSPHALTADVYSSVPAQGIYFLDAAYLMASSMIDANTGMAMPMGLWTYAVRLYENNGTTPVDVIFYPDVKMVMGGNVLMGKSSNIADQWTDMTGLTKPREYRSWLTQATANPLGGYDVSVVVTTVDMFMTMNNGVMQGGMDFPAVTPKQVLHDKLNAMNMRPAIAVNAVTVRLSADGGQTWTPAVEMPAGSGNYSANLAGVTQATAATVDVELTVNGNAMTTAGGTNMQLKFTAP